MQSSLETPRLWLRPFTEADEESLFALDADPEVMRWLTGGKPTPRHVIRDDVLPRMLRFHESLGSYGFWAAEEKSTREFLGWFEFRPAAGGRPAEVELGYRLRRSAWGRGYATEGARALIDRGFAELGVQRVVATTMAVNLASRRVLEKAGLTLVRTFHESWPDPIEGAEKGEVEYLLTRAEWERQTGLSG